jgi:hypothetical protein
LVTARRQNNMKFFSLNREMRAELSRALDAFLPASDAGGKQAPRRGRRHAGVE